MKLKLELYIIGLILTSLFVTIIDSDNNYWKRWLFLGDNFGYIFNKALSSLSITTIAPKFFFFLVLSLPFYLSYCMFLIFEWLDDFFMFSWSARTKKFVRFLLGVFCVFFIAVSYYIGFPLLIHYFPND